MHIHCLSSFLIFLLRFSSFLGFRTLFYLFYFLYFIYSIFTIMSSKRKVVDEFFINSSTIKNRKRINQMSEHEKQLNDAKRVDLANEIYHVKKLKIIKKWINVDVVKKKELKKQMKKSRKVYKYASRQTNWFYYIH